MRYSIVLFVFMISCLLMSEAQPYRQGIGVRIGSENGLSWHQFLNGSHTGLDLMALYRREGARLTALFTQHIQLGYRSDLYLYLGIGGHVGQHGTFDPAQGNRNVYGVDGQVGLQYVFPYSPFAVSFDIKPMMELGGDRGHSINNAGVTIRYYID